MTVTLEALPLEKLPEGRTAAAMPGGLPVLLARAGGGIYAVENRCAHMGCPLAAGTLEGHVLECPCHSWRFDLRTGALLEAAEIKIKTYPVEIRDGRIWIKAEL